MSYEKYGLIQCPAPRPFPGKYPTRIRIESRDLLAPFKYEGKPVPGLLSLVTNQFFKKGGNVRNLNICEFDQNGFVIRVRGGGMFELATFAGLYFPFPPAYFEFLGRSSRVFVMLDRALTTVGKKSLYRNQFWEGTKWAPTFTRLLALHAKGITNRNPFTTNQGIDIATHIDGLVDKWDRIEKKPTRPVAADIPPLPQWLVDFAKRPTVNVQEL